MSIPSIALADTGNAVARVCSDATRASHAFAQSSFGSDGLGYASVTHATAGNGRYA
jgi:hypothetical protein